MGCKYNRDYYERNREKHIAYMLKRYLNNKKNIIAGAIAVVGLYFVIRYFSKNKPKDTNKLPKKRVIVPNIPPYNFPLQKGSKGAYVTLLQKYILDIDSTLLPKFGADGNFGSETEAAVQKLIGKKSINGLGDLAAMNK